MTKTASKPLTTAKATSQAAARVRNVMAGEIVTATTRGSWDLVADVALVVTTVTFPPSHPAALDARAALMRMAGVRRVDIANGYMTIVRER